MSSQFNAVLSALMQTNYTNMAAMIAISYDYILTFSDEIEYIWSQPWTWVTFLFFIIRYVGLLAGFVLSVVGTSFLAGPWNICFAITILDDWSFGFFLYAIDLVMILRVYALYGQSKWILVPLILIFIPGAVLILLTCILYSIPKNDTEAIVPVANFLVCDVGYPAYSWRFPLVLLQLALAALLSILVTIQVTKQSLQMYRETKQWQLNRYMGLMVREGLLYFLIMLLYNVYGSLIGFNVVAEDFWAADLMYLVSTVPLIALAPRFVLNIRMMYARDSKGVNSAGIDTGFGLSSQSDEDIGTMAFAVRNPNGDGDYGL